MIIDICDCEVEINEIRARFPIESFSIGSIRGTDAIMEITMFP